MIRKIKREERYFQDYGWLKTFWLFSFSEYYDPRNMNFGSLRVFNDDLIMPGSGFPNHPHSNMEIVTIVLEGNLTHKDSVGNQAVISHSKVQRMSAGSGIVHSEWNAHDVPVRLYQLWFTPNKHTQAGYEEKQLDFSLNGLIPLATDETGGGLHIQSDAELFMLNLEAGFSHEIALKEDEGLFVYVSKGDLKIQGGDFTTGDQARISDENSISFLSLTNTSSIVVKTKLT